SRLTVATGAAGFVLAGSGCRHFSAAQWRHRARVAGPADSWAAWRGSAGAAAERAQEIGPQLWAERGQERRAQLGWLGVAQAAGQRPAPRRGQAGLISRA